MNLLKRISAALAALVLGALASCRTTDSSRAAPAAPVDAASSSAAAPASFGPVADAAKAADLASRPYKLVPPDGADAGRLPLVVLIHGYGSSGAGHDGYFGLSKATRPRGVLLAIVDGTRDPTGKQFWNASDACCNFYDSRVDDVAYLDAVIADVERIQPVDPSRIYLIGHSNGAFMAHRFACERAKRVAAIVALAGVLPQDTSACTGKGVSVLQVHGDADKVIEYGGGRSFGNGKPYPSANDTVREWARRDGCGPARTSAGLPLDLDRAAAGTETVRERFEACPAGIDVELWTMHGSGHVPSFGRQWVDEALDFLLRHHVP